MELGKYAAAFQSFQNMVDLKPNLNSYARVSYARELTGDLEGAIEAMKMAVAAGAPKSESTAWALVQLGNLMGRLGYPFGIWLGFAILSASVHRRRWLHSLQGDDPVWPPQR